MYSPDDIRKIIKAAPPLDAPRQHKAGSVPDHYLQARSFEEFDDIILSFLKAKRHTDMLSELKLWGEVEHERQHGDAITGLGGIAVPTLIVAKPTGSWLDRRYPFDIKTFAENIDPDSPELIVGTAYPEDLSGRDKAFLEKKGLNLPDVAQMAQDLGRPDLAPLSLHGHRPR